MTDMYPMPLSEPSPSPASPGAADAAPSTTRLVRAVVLALLGTTGVLAALLALANHPDWWRGFAAAGVASALAAAVSLVPMIWGLRRGLNQAVTGYFLAMGARAVISLGGCLLAVKVGNYPAAPTLLLMVPFYFAVLAAEATVVARALWNARG